MGPGSASRWRAVCGKRLGARAAGAQCVRGAWEREPLARSVREAPGSASLWRALCERDQGARASGAHYVGGAWERGPLARMVRGAGGTHRSAHQHAIGGGFQTRPYRAVTGMIGASTKA